MTIQNNQLTSDEAIYVPIEAYFCQIRGSKETKDTMAKIRMYKN